MKKIHIGIKGKTSKFVQKSQIRMKLNFKKNEDSIAGVNKTEAFEMKTSEMILSLDYPFMILRLFPKANMFTISLKLIG